MFNFHTSSEFNSYFTVHVNWFEYTLTHYKQYRKVSFTSFFFFAFKPTFFHCFQVWTDEFLVWDPEEFDGINEISLSSDAIWIPDIIVTET